MWKNILIAIMAFFIFVVFPCLYHEHCNHLNDVQYANYLTIPYKIKCIQSGEELHEWALKNVPAYWDSIQEIIPDEYVRYCYYHYYLEDNDEDTVDLETYMENFDGV